MSRFTQPAIVLLIAGCALVGTASFGTPAIEQGPAASSIDPQMIEAGRKSFETNCGECHTIVKDGRPSMGPNLWGLMGKKLGSNSSEFTYSDALFNSTLTWTPENLDKWIKSPPEFVPDNAMPYIGMEDAAERKAIVAYIGKASAQE
ncbi:c-type cytochrome [Sphingomonas montanisoli]|nr:c-type cytochrome [Sphingomonas montanisoli]